MSHSRQIPNAKVEKRAYSNQLSAHTEEEVRLLGGSGYETLGLSEVIYNRLIGRSRKNDPEAISIAKPVSRHSGMLKNVGLCLVRDHVQC